MRILRLGGVLCLLASGVACNPNTGGGGNSVSVSLGAAGMLSAGTDVRSTSEFFDITADLPTADRISATMSIAPADVTITDNGAAPTGPVTVTLLLFLSDGTAADPCASSPEFNQFTISLDSNGSLTVNPESSPVSETGFTFVDSGEFGICFVISADQEVDVTIDELQFEFTAPGPVAAASCDDVLALPEVQDALAQLATNGIRFSVPTGTLVQDLTGVYVLQEDTTFDPDGTDIGNTENGAITLTNQTLGTIERSGFEASIPFFFKVT